MEIKIHRANQIGGCITVIEHGGCKIVIDLGCNLPGNSNVELSREEIAELTKDANAVFYTHYHGDHIGLHHFVDIKVPQFIGAGAKDVMICKYNTLTKHGDYSEEIKSVESMMPYYVGKPIMYDGCEKIKVTPYLVSHSAFDAYMFKIECDGLKILHTGDFRRHGYLGKGLFPMLSRYVGVVDLLITEGTMLGRTQETVISENDIRLNVISAMKHKHVFALCSSTDIDRLASFHAACKETERVFVADSYQKEVLDVFTKHAGEKSNLFSFDKVFELHSYKNEKVVRYLKDKGFLMPVRSGMLPLIRNMIELYQLDEPWLVYSMWNGYADEEKDYANDDIIAIRKLFGNRILDGSREGFHTSGHADVETLAEICSLVKPRIGVIPIHKDECSRFDMDKVKAFKVFSKTVSVSDKLNIVIE